MIAAMRLTARAGDTVDSLVWRELGLGPSVLDAIFIANPGLAEPGGALPTGTIVNVPALQAAPSVRPLVQLWD